MDAFEPTYGGGVNDAFVTVPGPTGTLLDSTFLGGSGEDQGRDIALAASGDGYLVGFTSSADFPLARPLQSVPGGATMATPPG